MSWIFKNTSLVEVLKNGFFATLAMEILYRLTDFIFHHHLDVAYGIGKMFLEDSPWLIRIIGYLIYLFGGVTFSYLYARFVPKHAAWTGMLYGVCFLWLFVDGLIFEPNILGISFGMKYVVFNFVGHLVYGGCLGWMFASKQQIYDHVTEMKG